MPPVPQALRVLLSGAGYEVRFRGETWSECLVVRGGERWVGRGASEDAALGDAVDQMLPSHVGRDLLEQVLGTSPAPTEAPAAVVPPEPASEPTSVTAQPTPAQEGEQAPRIEVDHPVDRPTRGTALASLDAIAQGIETQLATFGRLSPLRQRTFLLIWICRARRFEDALPHEREVHRRIGLVARRLSELAKTFWPGSVRALQLTARPGELAELRVPGAAAPRDWGEASARADQVLEDQFAEAASLGLDEDGWLDDAPGPPAGLPPAQAQASAVAAVEALLGAKDGSRDPADLDAAAIDALTSAARRLRALRRFGDGVAWGVVMGKLRRLAPALGARGVRLRDALEPTRRA